MATTFHVTNWKNKVLNMLTGTDAFPILIGYVVPYNGVQPVDPSVVPAGSAEFASYASGPNMNGKLGYASSGISVMSAAAAPTTPANALSLTGITFARVYDTYGVPLLDCPASTSGGGGSIILDSLTSTAGIGNNVNAFSVKMPFTNGGTLLLGAVLANQLVNLWTISGMAVPQMGVNSAGACYLYLYSGTAPATADLPATGSLLATITIGTSNIWASASAGSAALVTTPSTTASGTGTVGYARMVKTNGSNTYTIQGSAGTTATDFVFNTVTLTASVTTVTLTDATLSI